MPGASVDVTTGLSVAFGTSSFAANIEGMSISGISRASIPTSHMGTAAPGANEHGNMTFMPGDLSDAGELSLEIQFNYPTTSSKRCLRTAIHNYNEKKFLEK